MNRTHLQLATKKIKEWFISNDLYKLDRVHISILGYEEVDILIIMVRHH